MSRIDDFLSDRRELDKEFRGLRRSKPMKRGRIKPVNKARKAKRFETDFGGVRYLEFIHGLECCICGALCEFTEAAHARSRGAGGKADDIVPLCGNRFGMQGCHSLFDTDAEFHATHKTRLRSLAKRLYKSFIEQQDNDEESAA